MKEAPWSAVGDWLGLGDQVAVVTGGGSGIGAAIAEELARHGARTAVLDRDGTSARSTVANIQNAGGQALALEVDVTSEADVEDAHGAVAQLWGEAHVLINNAGASGHSTVDTVSLADWQQLFEVNLTGYLLCSRTFGEGMRERGSGSIVHISSIAGINPQANSGAYSPSKAAVAMLSRLLAVEWGPDGVRSNAVAPGMTRTPMAERLYAVPGVLKARQDAVPLRRVAMPRDVAEVCVWLASERAGYVTGQEIAVDGGFTQSLQSHVPRPRA